MIQKRRQPYRAFVAEGNRQRVLTMRASGHDVASVTTRRRGESTVGRGEIGFDDVDPLPDLQHERGIENVLGGRTPMHVAARIAARRAAERPDHRDDGVADDPCAGADLLERQAIDCRGGGDRLGRSRRNYVEARLHPRQRRLDIEHALEQRPIVEHSMHLRRAVERTEDRAIRRIDGHRQTSRNTVSPLP